MEHEERGCLIGFGDDRGQVLQVWSAWGLRTVRRVVAGWAAPWIGERRAEDLTLAVGEAVTNGLLHGRAPVMVELWRYRWGRLCEAVAIVSDDGDGFAPELADLADPDDPARFFLEGGRGIVLMVGLCDWVCFGDGGRAVALGVVGLR